MTSQRKITTSRSNSLRSSGPRTAGGKRRASRNSRKHGFAAMNCRYPAGCAEVEQLASATCGDEQDAALLVQARIVAENELLLRAIRLQKLASIERVLGEARLNENKALELAARDLDALERYETRAWSRQMRAIREFIDIRRSEN
jgi:hypothetical protein